MRRDRIKNPAGHKAAGRSSKMSRNGAEVCAVVRDEVHRRHKLGRCVLSWKLNYRNWF